MQHLDDALIAEWVDGAIADDSPQHGAIAAHVDQCDECRTRVEEERALAGHVRQLLGVAAPPDRMPPFEEVLYRAGTAARRSPHTTWMRRLAWAATVVVAGGAGWYARGAMIGGPAVALDRAVPAVEADRAPATPAVGAVAQRHEPPADAAPVPSRDATPVTGRGAVLGEAQEQLAAGSRTATAADEGRRELAATNREATEERAMARRDAAPPAAPPAAVESRPMAQAVAPAENEVRLQKAAVEPWLIASRETAEAVLGAPLVALDSLPVVSIELSAGRQAVRLRQDLGGGTILELVQSRAPADADAVAGLAAGAVADAVRPAQRARAPEAADTVVVHGIRVAARAAISLDSMRVLLEKLRR